MSGVRKSALPMRAFTRQIRTLEMRSDASAPWRARVDEVRRAAISRLKYPRAATRRFLSVAARPRRGRGAAWAEGGPACPKAGRSSLAIRSPHVPVFGTASRNSPAASAVTASGAARSAPGVRADDLNVIELKEEC